MSRKNIPVVPAVTVPTQNPDSQSESFITVAQVAERLQKKTSTIWEWTRRRNKKPIPHYPVSRKAVYFKWSEVVRWLEGTRVA